MFQEMCSTLNTSFTKLAWLLLIRLNAGVGIHVGITPKT
jgi:hypothetical protein